MPKRKAEDSETQTAPKASRVDGEALLQEIWATELPEDSYDDYGNVLIYDNCNDIRRKVNAFLKKYTERGVTQTALLRLLSVNSNSFQRFMKLKGPASGAENNMYRKGYEFFEKLRVYEKKPKSAARKTAESDFKNGYELKDASKLYVIVPRDAPAPSIYDVMKSRAGTNSIYSTFSSFSKPTSLSTPTTTTTTPSTTPTYKPTTSTIPPLSTATTKTPPIFFPTTSTSTTSYSPPKPAPPVIYLD